MNECRAKKESASHAWKRLATRSLLVAILLAFSLFILIRILLLTPLSADYLSRTLSRYSKHKVTIAKLAVTGETIYLNGITIESPPGFTSRKLIYARAISLTPDIAGLVRGKRSISRLQIIGLRITAEKNSAGNWNFSSLLQLFSKKKEQPSGEITIKHLSFQDASIRINGHTVEKLGLTLADFSTKGTKNSRLELSGKDVAGNPLRLTAEGHLGDNPVFHVTADAPAISLAPLQQFLHGTPPLHLEHAQGKVTLSAELRNKVLDIQATAAFKQLSFTFSGKSLPIEGHLDLEGRYDFPSDSAELAQADLAIDNLLTIRASGSMQQVSKESSFIFQLIPDKTDIASLFAQLPETGRRGLSLSGEISSRGFQLKGNRLKGITTATGDLSFRKVALVQAKQLILAGGTADFSLRKTSQNWLLEGTIFSERQKDSPLIKSISIPLTARFSPRFKPVRVDAPTIKAVYSGIPLRGSFQYLDTAPLPFTLSCSALDVPLTALNGFLAKKPSTARFTSGKFTAKAKLSGISPQEFSGKVALNLISAAGRSAKSMISMKNGAILANVQKTAETFSANGSLEATGGILDGKTFGAKTGFTLNNREATLQNPVFTLAATRIQARIISGKLPIQGNGQHKNPIPIFAILAGAEVRSADVAASGISGRINAQYDTADQKRPLTGSADISVESLKYRNKPVASCTAHLTADGTSVAAEIKGDSLGGTLSARVRTGLFSKTRETSFSASLLKQKLEQLEGLFPGKVTPRISSGMADVLVSGTYTRQSGIEGKLAITGKDITLKDSPGKTLVSGIAATFDATVRGQNLTVKKAILSHTQGPSLQIGGAVEHFAAAERTAKLILTMPSTAINSLLDAFANALPRNLQEASCTGSCSLAGSLELHGTGSRLNGSISLESASLEIPSQKITITGIEGTLPFSLEFLRQGMKSEKSPIRYSRENYSRLVEGFDQTSCSGKNITIGTIRFGALETGALSLCISATRGIMRISPIKASLYDGRLLGNGYLILKGSPEYGADILLNDVSLKQFCDSFPSIKSYISGRVDGIVSLKNEKGGLKELTGYVDLWTRTGKGEEMLVSKEFLQKLAGKKLRGFFFQNDRPYDNGEIRAYLLHNYLTFEKLDISHTNFLGMKDLSVSVAPVQNRIALDHLLESIRNAAARSSGGEQGAPPVQTDLKWLE